MKSDFWLVGLTGGGRTGTMSFLKDDSETFWAPIDMPIDRTQALFNWAKSEDGFWKCGWIAEVIHDGLYEDGTPRNPKIIAVREWDLPFSPLGKDYAKGKRWATTHVAKEVTPQN